MDKWNLFGRGKGKGSWKNFWCDSCGSGAVDDYAATNHRNFTDLQRMDLVGEYKLSRMQLYELICCAMLYCLVKSEQDAEVLHVPKLLDKLSNIRNSS